jgi:PAS domain S-box-containing protein
MPPQGQHRAAYRRMSTTPGMRERDRHEEALRQSEARLQAAADLVGLAHYSWNPQTNALDWDARLRAICGLPADAHVDYEVWRSAVHPDDLPRVEAAMARCVDPQGDGVYHLDYRVIGITDGAERWVDTRGQTYFDRGRPVEFVGVALDITERKRAESDLIALKIALADELAGMTRLHEFSTKLTATSDLPSLLEEVLDATMKLHGADFGDVQLYNKQTCTLEIVAQRGFSQEFLDHFQRVGVDDISTCGLALKQRARVIIEDVNIDPRFALHRGVAAAAGFRAVQSTPLSVHEAGEPVGMLSTHFRSPHRPSDRDLRLTDLYARQAADVIAFRLAEQRLSQHEAQLAAILSQLPVGVGLVDPEGRFILRGGLPGSMWDAVMTSRDQRQRRRWRGFKADGSPLEAREYPGARALAGETISPGIDFMHKADDGCETWIRVAAAPFRNAAGEIEGAVAILENVDREKRAEQAIRESEERFRHFAEYSANVLWILNAVTQQLDYLSPAYEVVWGQPREENLSFWTQSIHEDDRERATAALERARLGEVVVHEYRIVRPDGAVRRVRDTLFPIRDRRGRVERIGGIAQDLTVRTGSRAYVIDGNEVSRGALTLTLKRAGYEVKAFASGADFLDVTSVLAPGCVVLDIRSADAGGLGVPRQLRASGIALPVIVTGTSRGDVKQAVQAMKAGAVEWLEVPYDEAALLVAVASALADVRNNAEQNRDTELARVHIAGMSVRERQVLEGLLAGGTNKTIGRDLDISPRTVELHRASVMQRLGVETLTEAVLLAAAAGVRPTRHTRKANRPR